jgi:sugar phosphate isomerase/epimerase
MLRRTFLSGSSGLLLSIAFGPSIVRGATPPDSRLGMSTVTFRDRFKQTASAAIIGEELTLLKVPAFYRERFGIDQLELWSKHFESLDPQYLQELRARVKAARSRIINVQVDADYDLANVNEEVRQQSLRTARQWIDAAALVGSRAVRVNPGHTDGSVDKAIASMKEVNAYCKSKNLPLLIENHFGLEMDPEVHLRIREFAGPTNVYTLPDFGNYPVDTMWASLKKILPYAYMVSAKTVQFDDRVQHVSFDFDRCVRLAEVLGFKGVYSVEQWSRDPLRVDPEKIVDWMLAHVRSNISR